MTLTHFAKPTITITGRHWTLYHNAPSSDAPAYMLTVDHGHEPTTYAFTSMERGSRDDILLHDTASWAVMLHERGAYEDISTADATDMLHAFGHAKMTPAEERIYTYLIATWEAFALTFNPAVL